MSGVDIVIGPVPCAVREAVICVAQLGGWTYYVEGGEAQAYQGSDIQGAYVGICYDQPVSTPVEHIIDCRSLCLIFPDDSEQLLVLLDAILRPKRGPIVVIRGIAGGVGTTLIATSLAHTIAGHHSTVFVDADPVGIGCIGGSDEPFSVAVPDASSPFLASHCVEDMIAWNDLAVCVPHPAARSRDIMASAVAAIRREAEWTVIDCGRGPEPFSAPPACVNVVMCGRERQKIRHIDADPRWKDVECDIALATHATTYHAVSQTWPDAKHLMIAGLSATYRAYERGITDFYSVSRGFSSSMQSLFQEVKKCVEKE